MKQLWGSKQSSENVICMGFTSELKLKQEVMSFEHLFPREKTSQGVDESFVGPSGRCREQRTSQVGKLENSLGSSPST